MVEKSIDFNAPPNQGDLLATPTIDTENPEILSFLKKHEKQGDPKATAIALFTAVRDEIRYDPYHIEFTEQGMRASTTLAKRRGYCVAKAVLYAALTRAAGIPTRLGFADVRNHLSTKKLLEAMGTDLFVFHGYAALFLDGKWIKATPTFNKELCEKFSVVPLDFDGERDALLQAFDSKGQEYMSYERDRGVFQDLPMEAIRRASLEAYPSMVALIEKGGVEGDFHEDAKPDFKG